MKVIRIKLFQIKAHFRLPITHVYRETYLLSPVSTIVGMVHAACGWNKTHKFNVSVQNRFESINEDYQRLNYPKVTGGILPIYFQELINVETIIHIYTENKEDYNTILECMQFPKKQLCLGRSEDIVCIKEIKEVEVSEKETEDYVTKYNIYSKDIKSDSMYTIPTFYTVDKKGIREFKIIDTYYISEDTYLGIDKLITDENNLMVQWLV